MGWNFDDNNNEKTAFTKFPEGITYITVLDADPDVRWTHWMQQYGKSVNCPGRGCPIDEIRRQQKAKGEAQTYNMSRRFAINVFNHETGRSEVMEQGVTFFEDLRDIMEDLRSKGKRLIDVKLKVRRRGMTKDNTSYRIDVEEDHDAVEVERLQAEPRTDLKEYFKPHTPEQILELLKFKATTPDAYKEAWNKIMGGAKDESTKPAETEEAIEVK